MQLKFPISEDFNHLMMKTNNTEYNVCANGVMSDLSLRFSGYLGTKGLFLSDNGLLDWTAAQAVLSLPLLLVLSYRGYMIMSTAYVGTDRLGVYMVPFYLPLLSTLLIT